MINEEIVARIQTGETNWMDILLEQNRGYIRKIAYRYRYIAERNRGMDEEDLFQTAAMGMIEAIEGWDPDRGSFLTVATFYMKNSIRKELGISTTKERIENVASPASLSTPVGEDGDGILQDLLVDPDAVDPQQAAEDTLMREHVKQSVREAVGTLQGPVRSIIHAAYFGRNTLAEIAESQGMSPENVRRLRNRGLRALWRHRKIRLLWAEYETVFYHHRTYTAWKYTNTSATEAAVLRREQMRERVEQALAQRMVEKYI